MQLFGRADIKLIVGLLILAALIFNLLMLSYPIWFKIACLVAIPCAIGSGVYRSSRRAIKKRRFVKSEFKMSPESYDLDWFALDKTGHLGYFASGGLGAVPRSVADDIDSTFVVLDYVKKHFAEVQECNVNAEALAKTKLGGRDQSSVAAFYRDFVSMAKRGLYAFNAHLWPEGRTPYYRVATPINPRSVTEVPSDIAEILKRTTLARIVFAEADEFDVPDSRDNRRRE